MEQELNSGSAKIPATASTPAVCQPAGKANTLAASLGVSHGISSEYPNSHYSLNTSAATVGKINMKR
tara:strand:- start:1064 stop:1264 length:201 start_codon:yes stop_codon:yes gene_type:complete